MSGGEKALSAQRRSDVPKRFFTADEQAQIAAAIAAAEQLTSGEIRLHVERDVPRRRPIAGDPYTRARQLFAQLGMHATAERNGVLVYLAVRAQRFAVVGDEQLHQRVGEEFWRQIAARMTDDFAAGRFTEGVVSGIAEIGGQLSVHFPRRADDVDELRNEISFGADPSGGGHEEP